LAKLETEMLETLKRIRQWARSGRHEEDFNATEADRDAAIAKAEADARRVELEGKANANATRVMGEADGAAIEARGLAKAKAIRAASEALTENQDAVIAQTIAEQYPEIVRAGAAALGNIDNLVVLNGGEGMEDLPGKALTMGGAGLGLAQRLMSSIKGEPATGVPVTSGEQPVGPTAVACGQVSTNGAAPV